MTVPLLVAVASMLAVLSVGELALAGRGTGYWARKEHASKLPGLLRRLSRVSPPRDLAARLRAAGSPGRLGVREWMGVKVGCAALAGGVSPLTLSSTPGRSGALLLVAGPVAGFTLPDLWLRRVTHARLETARRDLPDLLELLRVTVAAGMPPMRGIATIAGHFRGPLAVELERLAHLHALGEPQGEAFEELFRSLPCEEVGSFVTALRGSGTHGTPLASVLALQAESARHRRSQEIRERSARAGPKIQLVVALVLVPAVLLMLAAAVVAELPRAGVGTGF